MNRKLLAVAAVALAGSAFVACSSDDESGGAKTGNGNGTGNGSGSDGTVTVMSWWYEGGEYDALNALLGVFSAKYPDTTLSPTTAKSDEVRPAIKAAMDAGNPPDAFQAVAGPEVLQWVDDANPANTKLASLDDLAEEEGWASKYPAAVLDFNRGKDGKLYGVPISVERNNLLFFAQKPLADAKLAAPKSFDDVMKICAAFKAKGMADNTVSLAATSTTAKAPLAVGSKDGWTVSLLVFDGLFAGFSSIAYREEYFSGKHAASDPEIRATLEAAKKLLECSNGDRNKLGWSEATQRVFEGSSVMTIMGDWAKGTLTNLKWTPKTDFGAVGVPVPKPNFVFGAPTFATPLAAANPAGALDFLRVVGSVEGQTAFSKVKGSMPARNDADPADFDPMVGDFVTEFKTAALTPAWPSLTPPDYQSAMDTAFKEFSNGRPSADGSKFEIEPLDIDALVAALAAAHPLLTK